MAIGTIAARFRRLWRARHRGPRKIGRAVAAAEHTAEIALLAARGALRAGIRASSFVILARARSGSTLLLSLLQSHPLIRCRGEVYNALVKRIYWLFWDLPVPTLSLYLSGRRSRTTRAVGLKLFYTQAAAPRLRAVWSYLRSEPAIRVVHLKRTSLLRAHLSLTIARQTRRFARFSAPVGPPPTPRLDPQECLSAFARMRAEEREHDELFRDHPVLQVSYEQLVAHPAEILGEIQRFLGMPVRPLHSSLRKQETRPLHEAISNYDELRRALEHTEWASFFDDE